MSILKSLLDIQKDIRNLENSILEISANIKQVNDDIDEAVALAKCIMAAEAAKVPEAAKPIIREYENESKTEIK